MGNHCVVGSRAAGPALFKAAGLRIGHYGPKFAGLFFDDPQPWLFFVQHLVIGWVSTLPLLVILLRTCARPAAADRRRSLWRRVLRCGQLAGLADLLR